MDKFLDREFQRQLHRLDAGASAEPSHHTNVGSFSFSADNQQAVVNTIAEATAKDEAKKMQEMAQKKEEDEFTKMENTFITDLALGNTDLPTWMNTTASN
jgi:hypothetical protein